MGKVTATEARELAKAFRDAANSLADKRSEEWGDLKPAQRQELEDRYWSLLTHASDMTTLAVGLSLEDTQASASRIVEQIEKATKAIKTVNNIRTSLRIAGALLVLAASIIAQNPPAIVGSLGGLAELVGKIDS